MAIRVVRIVDGWWVRIVALGFLGELRAVALFLDMVEQLYVALNVGNKTN